MLIQQKDNGGLIYPSSDEVKVLKVAENVFEQYVDIRISSKFLRSLMKARVMKELLSENIFNILHEHDIEMHNPLEDFHSTQISKTIAEEYLNLWLFQYGQDVTANIRSDLGVRQKLTKLILFKRKTLVSLLRSVSQ